jgi:DNA-binding response OmpR family regulator
MAATLRTSGVEIAVADDSQHAVALFARQSFSVLIVDCDVVPTGGIELVHLVRALAIESVYVIMMTGTASGVQLEQGYCAGVDQHMLRDVAGAALIDRVQAAFKAIVLRRASRGLAFGHDVITVDLASGAHTARHLVGRLSAEIQLAQHTKRALEIVILRVHAQGTDSAAMADERLATVLEAVQTAVRPKSDWIACLHSVGKNHRLAVVLPGGNAKALEQHVRNAFVMNPTASQGTPELSFGNVTFQAAEGVAFPTALGLLAQAEPQRHAAAAPVAQKPEPASSPLPQEIPQEITESAA